MQNKGMMLAKNGKMLCRQIIIIVISLVVVSVIVAIAGFSPAVMLSGLLHGVTGDLGGAVRWSIPLIFTGLAASVAFKAEVFNLGIDGQLNMGALAGTWVALNLSERMPRGAGLLAIIAAGCLAGMVFALIPTLLYVRFKADLVVTTLLLNFVAQLLTDYAILGPLRPAGTASQAASTPKFSESFWLHKLGYLPNSNAHTGLYIAVAVAVIVWFVLKKTTTGYEIKLVGANPDTAQESGINVNFIIIKAMLLSGLIAGLAGAVEMTGVLHQFPKRFNDGLGFDGIVVAVLANNNPLGVLLSGAFFGALKNGAANLQRLTNIPRPMVEIIQATIILAVTVKLHFKKGRYFGRWNTKAKADGKEMSL